MDAIDIPQVHSYEYKRLVARAWDRFVASYPVDPRGLRGVVLESWRRCEAFGVDPGRRVAAVPHGAEPEAATRRRFREAIQVSLPPIASFLSETGAVLIASDATGILLAVEGDQPVVERLANNGAIPGAAWPEHQIGTNAIGTALTLGRAVQIHGQEHFCEAGKPWSCTAAPLYDVGDGTVLGVVDVTGPASAALAEGGALVMSVARQVQGLLAQQDLADRAKLLEFFADHKPRTGEAALVDRQGRIVKATPGARWGDVMLTPGMRLEGLNRENVERDCLCGLAGPVGDGCMTKIDDGGDCLGIMLRLPDSPRRAAAQWALPGPLKAILDGSPSLMPVLEQAYRYALRRFPLLLQGETGTGKDLLAAAIHRAGPAPVGPFVAVNCAAIPRDLIASELFGHADGAFTGARRGGSKGRFEQADGGTLFLDEIGDMPLEMQPYLLRAIEEQVVTRLGEGIQRRVDVRVIAATNRPLPDAVADGTFRADLLYRLNTGVLYLPPLRERLGDLPHLVSVLLRQIMPAGAENWDHDSGLLAKLGSYHWPGNVRELRSALTRMATLSSNGTLDPSHLGIEVHSEGACGPLRDTEKTMILAAMAATNGNATRAARSLGISRATIYRRLNTYQADAHLRHGTR